MGGRQIDGVQDKHLSNYGVIVDNVFQREVSGRICVDDFIVEFAIFKLKHLN